MKSFHLILVCTFLFCTSVNSQNIDILRKSDTFQRNGKQHEFIYWSNPADTTGLEYVATLSSRESAMAGKELWILWSMAGNRSQKLGANVFIFRSFSDTDSTKAELVLDLYFASDEALQRNAEREEKNKVYLFGNKGKPMSVKVNDDQAEIPANSHLRYELPAGTELKLSKGGLTGAKWTLKGQEGKTALYFSVSGPGLGGAVPPPSTVGISVNGGRITEMNPHFAHVLMDIQKM